MTVCIQAQLYTLHSSFSFIRLILRGADNFSVSPSSVLKLNLMIFAHNTQLLHFVVIFYFCTLTGLLSNRLGLAEWSSCLSRLLASEMSASSGSSRPTCITQWVKMNVLVWWSYMAKRNNNFVIRIDTF